MVPSREGGEEKKEKEEEEEGGKRGNETALDEMLPRPVSPRASRDRL